MKKTVPLLVLLCGIAGVIGVVALPFVMDIKAIDVPKHGPILLGAFAIPAILGLVGLVKGGGRSLGVTAAIGFAVAGMKSAGGQGQVGQTVCLLAAFAGVVLAIIMAAKPPTPVQQWHPVT
jgi:hypothetical protein